MRPSIYKELPAEKRACFGVGFPDQNPACGACREHYPGLADICLNIRAGKTADGYIRLPGHDPIRVTRNQLTGGAVYQVEPEAGPRPPAVAEIRRALIFAERADYEPPALLLGMVTSRLFPDCAEWVQYPELYADERPTKTKKRRERREKRPTRKTLAPAGDTLF